MIAIPIIVWLQVRRGGAPLAERIGWKRTNLRSGLSVGIVMGGVILAGYYGLLRGVIDPGPVLAKVRSLGLVEYYWYMSIFICLGNALFEEYYWRAFLIGELRSYLRSKPVLCIVAGGLFGVHHLFAMLGLFDLPMVLMFVLVTMIAGAVWSAMRCRGASILDCYVSHVLADMAIMWIGYDLLSRAL